MDNPKIETLISCMHQTNSGIARNSNTFTDVLIINQCDLEDYSEESIDGQKIRMYSTRERGLSRSRNRALENAAGDVCLLCDDDEIFEDDYAEKIERAYQAYPDADIIAFRILLERKVCWSKPRKIGYLTALKLSSCQLTFKRESIARAGIMFDVNYGSGTSNGAGEENIFLYDCLKKKLKIYYVPDTIARIKTADSSWFHGYDKNYFINRGIFTKRLMGRFWATLYAAYFVLTKYKMYKSETSMLDAACSIVKGIYFGRINSGGEVLK